MARTKRKVRDEDDEESEEEEEEESRRSSRSRGRKASRKAKKEESEDEEENVLTSEDHPLFSIKRNKYDSSQNYIQFKAKQAQLKNVVQQLCQNYTPNGQYKNRLLVDELFLMRDFLRMIGTPNDPTELTKEDGDLEMSEKNPQAKRDEEETFQQRVKQTYQTQRQQYAHMMGNPTHLAGLIQLADWVTEECKDRIEASKALLAKKQVNFDALSQLYTPGVFVTGHRHETGPSLVGYRVLAGWYQFQPMLYSKYKMFCVIKEFVVATGDGQFIIGTANETIPEFPGTLNFNQLHLVPMEKETVDFLSERGSRYAKLATGHHYMAYTSDSFVVHRKRIDTRIMDASSTPFLRGTGRLMLDTEAGRRLGHFAGSTVQPLLTNHHQLKLQASQRGAVGFGQHYFGMNMGQQQNTNTMDEVPKSMLCLCWPAIAGFSFSAKAWGHVLIEGVSEIKFNDNAFDQLVLAPERKKLIQAMVRHSEVVFKDIISGKGGGCVFLLHGPPGCGKTLTAEAVSEMLHRPLYVVTMGELGTTAAELEASISEILELVTMWKALVLLDEADIFLEKRGHKEILRNAMIGVLMRQVEYFQGVLFLTTNRVAQFDEAFHSRMTVALQYKELSADERTSVWESLLKVSGISNQKNDIDTKALGKFPLNGRQIKNSICLAQGLARAEEGSVTMKHLNHTIAVCMEFKQEMDAAAKYTHPE